MIIPGKLEPTLKSIIFKKTVQIRTIATTATNMLECKKGANFLLSVLTSDWLKQQKLTKLHKAVYIFILTFQPSSI